jgi:hypothetical protein
MLIFQILFILYLLSALGTYSWFTKLKSNSLENSVYTKNHLRDVAFLIPVLNTLVCHYYLVQLYQEYKLKKALKEVIEVIKDRADITIAELENPYLSDDKRVELEAHLQELSKTIKALKDGIES